MSGLATIRHTRVTGWALPCTEAFEGGDVPSNEVKPPAARTVMFIFKGDTESRKDAFWTEMTLANGERE